MKVRVRLFGTLSRAIPDYQPSQGIEVEVPETATARDLLDLLGVSESSGAVVIAEGRILEGSDTIQGQVPVSVMQAISGG